MLGKTSTVDAEMMNIEEICIIDDGIDLQAIELEFQASPLEKSTSLQIEHITPKI